MSAGEYDLEIEQGSEFARTMTVSADLLLTGYTARAQVRRQAPSNSTLASWTTESGHLTIDTVANTITLTVPATETRNFGFELARWDLELIPADGEAHVQKLLKGAVRIDPENTR